MVFQDGGINVVDNESSVRAGIPMGDGRVRLDVSGDIFGNMDIL